MWIGLKVKSQARAMIIAILGLTAWCGVPALIAILVFEMSQSSDLPRLLFCLGPSGMILLNELHAIPQFLSSVIPDLNNWFILLSNYGVYLMILWMLRSRCLRYADQNLGRREDQSLLSRKSIEREIAYQEVDQTASLSKTEVQ